jgi:hypothetical protein
VGFIVKNKIHLWTSARIGFAMSTEVHAAQPPSFVSASGQERRTQRRSIAAREANRLDSAHKRLNSGDCSRTNRAVAKWEFRSAIGL